MLRPGGHFILISDLKQATSAQQTAYAKPDFGVTSDVNRLIAEYLGGVRRAGRRVLPNKTPSGEEEILCAAGYFGPRWLVVNDPGLLFRSMETLVADIYSRSNSAPHLFGERLDEFDTRLREILSAGSIDEGYEMAKPSTEARIWANPGPDDSPDVEL